MWMRTVSCVASIVLYQIKGVSNVYKHPDGHTHTHTNTHTHTHTHTSSASGAAPSALRAPGDGGPAPTQEIRADVRRCMLMIFLIFDEGPWGREHVPWAATWRRYRGWHQRNELPASFEAALQNENATRKWAPRQASVQACSVSVSGQEQPSMPSGGRQRNPGWPGAGRPWAHLGLRRACPVATLRPLLEGPADLLTVSGSYIWVVTQLHNLWLDLSCSTCMLLG